ESGGLTVVSGPVLCRRGGGQAKTTEAWIGNPPRRQGGLAFRWTEASNQSAYVNCWGDAGASARRAYRRARSKDRRVCHGTDPRNSAPAVADHDYGHPFDGAGAPLR